MIHSVRRVAVTVAAASLLAVGVSATPALAAEPATDLLISEVVEGSSNNKAFEIANPTDAAIDLSTYSVAMYFNGSATSTLSVPLTGTVAAGDVHVVVNALAGAPLLAFSDQTVSGNWFNGDDALVLRHGDAVVDSFGQVGSDPGSEWGSGQASTQDNTLRRLASVCVGDTNTTDAFDPATQWAGFPVDTFDGLGSHTTDCGDVEPAAPVINEFSASTAGDDVEYVELLAEPGTDLSGLRVLEIEGDFAAGAPTAPGTVDEVISFGAPDADGRALATLPANALENGTVSLLLVQGFAGALGNDLDANDDGTLELPDGVTLVDAVAVNDGGAGDRTYGGVTLGVAYDGLAFAPGGASRIPDGADTDTSADWVRNDFDKAGIPGNTGTLIEGEALNTPGAANSTGNDPEPPGGANCEAPTVAIGSVQGATDVSPVVGSTVELEGTVVGDFQTGGFDGYYLQDAGDGNAATSDGIFVFASGGLDVALGDQVHVVGKVSEFFGMTEVTATGAAICATGGELPPAAQITLPADPAGYEALEGMRVTLPQSLKIEEYFEFGRFGTVTLGTERHMQPTAVYDAGSPEAIALAEANARDTITLDDGRSQENPDPAIHPNGEVFTLANTFRGGDLVANATGVLDYRFDTWGVQPTEGADFTSVNPRPAVPEVGGTTTVASFNVLNYFTTLNDRGANTAEEFERQEAKIVSAISQLDADVVGLIEIENNGGTAVNTLVDALNEVMGAGTYDAIDTGVVGTDAITTAFIYKPAEVEPVGRFAILDTSVDPRFLDDFNRPALAQTYRDLETGGDVTVVVNHLKSKGSDCNAVGDPTDPIGQGNCNGVRTAAAEALVDWLATGPTGAEPGRDLIIGDLNSYDKEDPIQVITGAGYTDLTLRDQGEFAYSYVFDGQLGYLDYALAGSGIADEVTKAEHWNINSDEPSLIDYDMTFKKPAQDALFAPDPFRSSDHDPVLIGLDLTPPDTTAPELVLTATPDRIFPPNNKWRTVTVDVEATDDSGGPVTVELVDAQAAGHKAEVRVVSDTEFQVVARIGAEYTFTYEATDASGNTAAQSVTVRVGP
ncbi:putative extracellular nuclease [Agromyces sp. 3263]|uniref:ExeM/NucH family extracellular endonuclease n=1 Tax=Agromyces sp. 3263 TaxID=2817750 RepID=UPI00285758CD|nr:ExeM/NucH family extracellular endonuclease [Agromyces sp. 3263]MDR6905934.1 putative extracellular nuclease [Agromyces sp. 3263]